MYLSYKYQKPCQYHKLNKRHKTINIIIYYNNFLFQMKFITSLSRYFYVFLQKNSDVILFFCRKILFNGKNFCRNFFSIKKKKLQKQEKQLPQLWCLLLVFTYITIIPDLINSSLILQKHAMNACIGHATRHCDLESGCHKNHLNHLLSIFNSILKFQKHTQMKK